MTKAESGQCSDERPRVQRNVATRTKIIKRDTQLNHSVQFCLGAKRWLLASAYRLLYW